MTTKELINQDVTNGRFKAGFKSGAQWQKEQDYKNLERLKKSWFKEGKIEGKFEGITDDVKYQQGYHDAKERMMKDAIEGFIEGEMGRQEDEPNEVYVVSDSLDTTKFKIGDKVKVIIIKE